MRCAVRTEMLQNPRRRVRGQQVHDVPRDREYGPVVDFENPVPRLCDLALGIVRILFPQPVERQDFRVQICNPVVKDHSVRHNRASHAARLRHIGHAKQVGNLTRRNWAQAAPCLFSTPTALSIPASSALAAALTVLWGTDTRRASSATSAAEPCSQPDSGKRSKSAPSSSGVVSTQ